MPEVEEISSITKQWANEGAVIPALKCRIETLTTIEENKFKSKDKYKLYTFLQDTLRICDFKTLGEIEFNVLYRFIKKLKFCDLELDLIALDTKKVIKREKKLPLSNDSAMRLQLDTCAFNLSKKISSLLDKRYHYVVMVTNTCQSSI